MLAFTVVGDAVPEFLTHVMSVISRENLLLHRFVAAVGTERRVASEADHMTT